MSDSTSPEEAKESLPERLVVMSEEIEGGVRLTLSGGGMSEPIVVTGSDYDTVSCILLVQALGLLCSGWTPPEDFYAYWQSTPAPKPVRSFEAILDRLPPEQQAMFEAQYQEQLAWHEKSPWLFNLTIHAKEYHFWTGAGLKRDEQLAWGIETFAHWLNNPIQRSPQKELEELAEEGELLRNLWGPAF